MKDAGAILINRAMILGAIFTTTLSLCAGLGWATMETTQAVTVPAAHIPAVAVPAHTRQCVRKRDYRKVRSGYTRDRVAGELHNRGRLIRYRLVVDRQHQLRVTMTYRYPACRRGRYIIVRFRENPARQIGGRIVLTSTSKAWIKR